jgi:hypothetical protein
MMGEQDRHVFCLEYIEPRGDNPLPEPKSGEYVQERFFRMGGTEMVPVPDGQDAKSPGEGGDDPLPVPEVYNPYDPMNWGV